MLQFVVVSPSWCKHWSHVTRFHFRMALTSFFPPKGYTKCIWCHLFFYIVWLFAKNQLTLYCVLSCKLIYGIKEQLSCIKKLYTVKPAYSGHLRDLKKVSAIDRCPLRRGSYCLGVKMTFSCCWGLGIYVYIS